MMTHICPRLLNFINDFVLLCFRARPPEDLSTIEVILLLLLLLLLLRGGGGVHDKLHISSADWWDIVLPLAYTPDRRDRRILMSPSKDTGKAG